MNMNKSKIYTLLLAGVVGVSACDRHWETTEVPAAVEKNFVQLYPTAERVEWEKENGYYEAEFELSTWERKAIFSADGSLIKYLEEIEKQYLPVSTQEMLENTYAAYTIDEVHRVQQEQKTFYEVALEQNSEELVLLFDEQGILLEQQTNSQNQAVQLEQAALSSSTAASASASRLPQPSAQWQLPSELLEVSGIALVNNDLMACVQDEEGSIFFYDLNKKAITRKIEFAGRGDYEGIAVVDNSAYVLRSDGALYKIAPLQGGKPKSTFYKSVLPKSLDTEGIAYDKANKRLLIAPKGHDEQLGNEKGIYAFSLAARKMQQEPVIRIPLGQQKLAEGSKDDDLQDRLQPSSMEIHPSSGEIYLIDAENFNLLTINAQGEIQKLIPLDEDRLRQPEGFTFSEEGALYISSEGKKKGSGLILKFTEGF